MSVTCGTSFNPGGAALTGLFGKLALIQGFTPLAISWRPSGASEVVLAQLAVPMESVYHAPGLNCKGCTRLVIMTPLRGLRDHVFSWL